MGLRTPRLLLCGEGAVQSLPSQGRWLGAAETERLSRICNNLSVCFADSSPERGAFWGASCRSRAPPLQSAEQIKITSPQKGADQQIWSAPSIYSRYSKATSCKLVTPVSGGAQYDTRRVTIVWNAKPKHCVLPEFRGRMHPASPSTLFSPIFSLAREKMGPSET